jgi:hypothetical protein
MPLKAKALNIIPKGNVVIATRVGRVCVIEKWYCYQSDLRGVIQKKTTRNFSLLFVSMVQVFNSWRRHWCDCSKCEVAFYWIIYSTSPLPEEQQQIVAMIDGLCHIWGKNQCRTKILKKTKDFCESYLQSFREKVIGKRKPTWSSKKKMQLFQDLLVLI